MVFSSLQQPNHLRRRLRWWLVVLAAVGLIVGVAVLTRGSDAHGILLATAVLMLLAIGVWVDQVALSAPTAHYDITTRDALLELNQRLVIEANTDPLTGLYNRRGLKVFFHGLVSTQRFSHQSIAVLMIDLDGLKSFNDRYGHPAGDQALRHTADILRDVLRRSDGIGRWGGDEFCVILPNTALSQAVLVAKKLCLRMTTSPLDLRQVETTPQVKVNASIGVVAVDAAQAFGIEALVAGADGALFQAKAAGGNTAVGVRLD